MLKEIIISEYTYLLRKDKIDLMIEKIPEVYAIVLKERQIMLNP